MDFRRLIYSALLLAAGCQSGYELTTPLSVTAETLSLTSEAGSTHIIVYSNTDWTVSLDREAEWASLSKLSGSGMHDLVFSYSANYGVSREVGIVISTADRSVKVEMVQSGAISNPSITFAKPVLVSSCNPRTLTDSMTTNLTFCLDEIKARAVYYSAAGDVSGTFEVGDSEGWVNSYSVNSESVTFSIGANTTGIDRKADVVFYVADGSGSETRSTISLTQSGAAPSFVLESASGEYYANGRTYSIPASLNNIWSSDGISLSATEPWIRDMAVDSTGLSFYAERNQDGARRSAQVNLSYTEDGSLVEASYTVSQLPNMKLSFEELRSLPSGTLTNDDIFEGLVVSDRTSPNLCSSPQTGQYAFDRAENSRTAYIESEDGLYGVMVKFAEASDNVLEQFSKVQVNLNGVTVRSLSSPSRTVLDGVKRSSFTVLASPGEVAVPEKKKTVSQLSDSDIYTLVTLQGMEIMQKDGCYTNCSDAFSLKDDVNPYSGTSQPWWDVAPLLCHDRSGSAIHMLTNAAAPWRRDGTDLGFSDSPVVPQGSGEIRGIVVADEVAPVRYGDLGQYQIRPMSEDDIALSDAAYATTIVEWNWNDFSPAITPTTGSGTLDVSGLADSEGKTTAAVKSLSCDYNNTYNGRDGDSGNGNSTANMAGLIKNGALKLTRQWWNHTQNKGEFFDIKFNMSGVSGSSLFVGLVWGHGEGSAAAYTGPSHWTALYSVDGGVSWTALPGVIENRSCICADNYSLDACPGFTEHIINLPVSCFGKTDVRVRLQVADNVCDAPAPAADYSSALCIGQGTLSQSVASDNCQVVLGTITVRYN